MERRWRRTHGLSQGFGGKEKGWGLLPTRARPETGGSLFQTEVEQDGRAIVQRDPEVAGTPSTQRFGADVEDPLVAAPTESGIGRSRRARAARQGGLQSRVSLGLVSRKGRAWSAPAEHRRLALRYLTPTTNWMLAGA